MGKINQYPECTTPNNDDWLLIETSEGTKKVKKSTLLKAVVDLLGDDDISEIADGTVTGAIAGLNAEVKELTDDVTDLNNDLNKHSFGTAVSLVANQNFTVPSDGYIKLLCMPTATAVAWVDVNGVEKLLRLASENGYGQGMGDAFSEVVTVKKGMTLKFNGTHGATCTFYPFT